MNQKLIYFQNVEKWYNIFSLIASFGSIAGWLTFEGLRIVWACIQGLASASQVIKPVFPFSNYIFEINKKINESEKIILQLEIIWDSQWDNSNGIMDNDKEIKKLMAEATSLWVLPDSMILEANENERNLQKAKVEEYIRRLKHE